MLRGYFTRSLANRLVLASLLVPDQLATCQPLEGVAEREMDSPATYSPAPQPSDFAGVAMGSLPLPVWVRVSR